MERSTYRQEREARRHGAHKGASEDRLRVLVLGEVLLADALTELLRQHNDDVTVLSPLYDPGQMLSSLRRLPPINVILLPWSDPTEDHRSVLRGLAAQQQRCILIPFFRPSARFLARQRQAGAWGVLTNTSTIAEVSTAIRAVAAGQVVFPRERGVRPRMRSLGASRQPSETAPGSLVFSLEALHACAARIGWHLHPQDVEILRHLFEGNDEMAATLHRSKASIRRSLSERIYDFLSLLASRPVRERAAACRIALEWGIHAVLPVTQEHNGEQEDD